jgi:hypothetical protein
VHVKGALTVGENTADIAGVAIAYDAFKLTEARKRHDETGWLYPRSTVLYLDSQDLAGKNQGCVYGHVCKHQSALTSQVARERTADELSRLFTKPLMCNRAIKCINPKRKG